LLLMSRTIGRGVEIKIVGTVGKENTLIIFFEFSKFVIRFNKM